MKAGAETKKRRLIIRAALVLTWVGLGILLFIFNRGHSLLLDNRNVENPSLRAPDFINVRVDKSKNFEFFRGDRDMVNVGGGRHRIIVEYDDGTPRFETTFTLPLGPDMFILSIPKMVNGVKPYFEVFHVQSQPVTQTEDE
jgi:hypothetical protein